MKKVWLTLLTVDFPLKKARLLCLALHQSLNDPGWGGGFCIFAPKFRLLSDFWMWVRCSAFLLQNWGYEVIFGWGEVFCIFNPKSRLWGNFWMWVRGSAFLLQNVGYGVIFLSLGRSITLPPCLTLEPEWVEQPLASPLISWEGPAIKNQNGCCQKVSAVWLLLCVAFWIPRLLFVCKLALLLWINLARSTLWVN